MKRIRYPEKVDTATLLVRAARLIVYSNPLYIYYDQLLIIDCESDQVNSKDVILGLVIGNNLLTVLGLTSFKLKPTLLGLL